MYRVDRTVEFENWLDGLRDEKAQEKIAQRIRRVESGLLGDWKTVHEGVSELRIDYGPGYRLYYTMRERVIVILLCGSTKRDQDRAIKLAKVLAKSIGAKEI
jgi:putative addiction module killer protein